jgi:hypothetical protein
MIGEALGWKYDHAQGIKTKNNKLVAWPNNLGPKPTTGQINVIVQEYQAHLEANKPLTVDEKIQHIDDSTFTIEQKEVLKKVLF